MRAARLARTVWNDAAFADDLEKQAADLKRRFNRDFWVAKDEYFALALDENGQQVDALASNNGHLLWSGIVDKSKAKAVVRHLMGPRPVLGLGRAHARRRPRPLQPDRLSRRHGLAVRQLVHRVGTTPLRLQGGSRADRVRDPRRGRVLRRPAPRSLRRIPARTQPSTRCSTRPRAARKRGRPERRCCSCARCSASNRPATISSSTHCSPTASVRSSCSTFPAAGAASTPSPANADRHLNCWLSAARPRGRSRWSRAPERIDRVHDRRRRARRPWRLRCGCARWPGSNTAVPAPRTRASRRRGAPARLTTSPRNRRSAPPPPPNPTFKRFRDGFQTPLTTSKPPSLHQVQRRLTPGDVDKICTRYINGKTITELARFYEVNPATIMNHLQDQGVPRRRVIRRMDLLTSMRPAYPAVEYTSKERGGPVARSGAAPEPAEVGVMSRVTGQVTVVRFVWLTCRSGTATDRG